MDPLPELLGRETAGEMDSITGTQIRKDTAVVVAVVQAP
jgi:hypothetical protein